MIGSESPVEQLQTDILHTAHTSNTAHNTDNHTTNNTDFATDITHHTTTNTTLIHNACPTALLKEYILLIHSNRDRVISALQIKQLAEMWELPEHCLHVLKTVSIAETLGMCVHCVFCCVIHRFDLYVCCH